jgi:hypothetical protein
MSHFGCNPADREHGIVKFVAIASLCSSLLRGLPSSEKCHLLVCEKSTVIVEIVKSVYIMEGVCILQGAK